MVPKKCSYVISDLFYYKIYLVLQLNNWNKIKSVDRFVLLICYIMYLMCHYNEYHSNFNSINVNHISIPDVHSEDTATKVNNEYLNESNHNKSGRDIEHRALMDKFANETPFWKWCLNINAFGVVLLTIILYIIFR